MPTPRRVPCSPRCASARGFPRQPLVVEQLEDRTVLDGTVKLSNGLLTITGTGLNDTVLIQQIPQSPCQPDQVAVTLNGRLFTFKVTLVNQIQAQLLAGNDSITLDESVRPVTPPLTLVDGGAGIDAVVFRGTAGADAITVTGTQVTRTGAGALTYANFESLLVDALAGDDTVTMTGINAATTTTIDGGLGTDTFAGNFGSFTGNLSLAGFENATMTVTVDFTGTLAVGGPLQGLTVTGTVTAGSTITATNLANVNIGTLAGALSAPEIAPGSGNISDATIGTIAPTGSVSAGHISGMTVTEANGPIKAAGQGTTTNVSIGTLSSSFTAPE